MSSLVFLGISIITFVLVYGLMFYLAPMIIGEVYSHFPTDLTPEWMATYTKTTGIIQWLIPLIPTFGIILVVLKVLMVASVKGAD